MNYNFPLHHYSDYDKVEKDATVVKPGTVILTCKPFGYALSPSLVEIHCDTCFKLEGKSGGYGNVILSRCGGCQQVKFCNRGCQRKGWSDGHKYECKGFSIQKKVAGTFTRLLLRIIVRLQKNGDYYDEITRRKIRRRFKDLVSHYAELRENKERMEQVTTMCNVVRSMLQHHPEINIPNDAELLGICGRIYVNTFSITDFENHTLGIGLYVGASIFDHSCEPMAVPSFESTDIAIRNIKEIPITMPIHKITINYRDVLRPSTVRRAQLKKSYYFDCQCERCSDALFDDEMQSVICPTENCYNKINVLSTQRCAKCGFELDSTYLDDISETETATKARVAEMSDKAYLDVAEVHIRMMKKLNFSDTHWLMVEMNGIAFDGSLDLQRWDTAYQVGMDALKGYRKYCSPFDVVLSLMLLKMAKLAWYLEKEKEAKSFIAEAKKMLDVTHGQDTGFAIHHIFPLIREISLCSELQNGLSLKCRP